MSQETLKVTIEAIVTELRTRKLLRFQLVTIKKLIVNFE